MKMKGIGALRDENGGMSQIPEPTSAASAPAPGPESPARPARVNIDSLIVRPRARASNTAVARD